MKMPTALSILLRYLQYASLLKENYSVPQFYMQLLPPPYMTGLVKNHLVKMARWIAFLYSPRETPSLLAATRTFSRMRDRLSMDSSSARSQRTSFMSSNSFTSLVLEMTCVSQKRTLPYSAFFSRRLMGILRSVRRAFLSLKKAASLLAIESRFTFDRLPRPSFFRSALSIFFSPFSSVFLGVCSGLRIIGSSRWLCTLSLGQMVAVCSGGGSIRVLSQRASSKLFLEASTVWMLRLSCSPLRLSSFFIRLRLLVQSQSDSGAGLYRNVAESSGYFIASILQKKTPLRRSSNLYLVCDYTQVAISLRVQEWKPSDMRQSIGLLLI